MSTLFHLADRVLNRPLLITPDKAALIAAVLGGRIGLGDLAPHPEASRFAPNEAKDERGRPTAPYLRTPEGVGIITVIGSLVNRGANVGASSGLTSYEGIKHQLATAAADPKVRSIILDLATPGGEAIGCFEAAKAVRDVVEAGKPVTAVVNGMAASAGYALASAASRIVTTPTGVSGSIGVVLMHADLSRAVDKAGITPTFIFAGAHKVDGNPLEPLPDEVRADLQAEVDAFYDGFVDLVASGRRNLSPAAVRATEARTYVGRAALDIGLVDEVGTFEDVLAEMSRQAVRSTRVMKGLTP